MEPLTNAQEELYNWLTNYIRTHQHSPSIRQMMRAMGLKSPAPIQSRLDHLRKKGYIDWNEGKARTIRVLQGAGVPIKGTIAAGSMVEAFADVAEERLDLSSLPIKARDYALRVRGDSMVDALIDNGDYVIMRPVEDPAAIRDGTIVAARVESATTLKYLYREGNDVVLKPANPNYEPMVYPAQDVDIQGRLLAVWRSQDLS
ncbi:transcriptional repressor LexA [Leptothoe kymatousa]|uniref:LexA repressor n=1 Tax=Leptothoe kymatousa TAU-MAC 1615 TaxID=2364775 RepID=A0ABS5XYL1_9CYAN|nr:transcriptional repressor LexA [Leptothoe kymatousa]MBT9310710.1 repressor LexA [Leptothoe kymatousa TAU-MAC 1615]